jgi:hypothetical protein
MPSTFADYRESRSLRKSMARASEAGQARRPFRVDAVEKVENRTTPKISQMLIFGLLRRYDAL